MARDRRPTPLRRTLVSRRTGWALVALLAILGILLGAQEVARAARLAGRALGDAAGLVLEAGWLLLLLAAAGLAGGLVSRTQLGVLTTGWLRPRLQAREREILVGAGVVGLLVVLALVLVLAVVMVPPPLHGQPSVQHGQ